MECLHELHILKDNAVPFVFRENLSLPLKKYTANWHKNIEILCFTKGSGYVTSDLTDIPVAAGDAFVVNSCCLHQVNCNEEGLVYHCLIIDEDFCLRNGFDINKLIFKSLITDKRIFDFFTKLAGKYRSEEPFTMPSLNIVILEILLILARDYLLNHNCETSHNPSLEGIKNGISYITAHFNEHLSLDILAKNSSMSRFSFSREFKKLTGRTVVEYINYIRCSQAGKFLGSKKYSAGQVASICGFDNFSYFSKTYKRVMGFLPSQTPEL